MPGPPPVVASDARPRPGLSDRTIFLLVGAGFLLLLVLTLVLARRTVAPSADESAALVTAREVLAAAGSTLAVDTTGQRAWRQVSTDGSVTIEYHCESKEPFFFEFQRVMLNRDRLSTVAGFIAGRAGFARGMLRGPQAKLVDRNDLLAWGDQSKSQVVLFEGQPRGNFFIARKGDRLMMLQLGGLAIEDSAAFRALLLPKLEAMDRLRR